MQWSLHGNTRWHGPESFRTVEHTENSSVCRISDTPQLHRDRSPCVQVPSRHHLICISSSGCVFVTFITQLSLATVTNEWNLGLESWELSAIWSKVSKIWTRNWIWNRIHIEDWAPWPVESVMVSPVSELKLIKINLACVWWSIHGHLAARENPYNFKVTEVYLNYCSLETENKQSLFASEW